jgi:phenol hydroxylase P4 protein
MAVTAITPDYQGEYRDAVDRFHGQQLLNICWEKHTMFGWPMCIPVSPDLPFAALMDAVIPSIFGQHPDFASIDWSTVQWSTAKGPFKVERDKTLAQLGLRHKAQIRFRTPGLDGYRNAG